MVAILRAELAKQHGDAERTIQFVRQGLAEAALADPWATGQHRYFAVRGRYTLGRASARRAIWPRRCAAARGTRACRRAGRPPLPAAGVAHIGLAEILY